MSERVTGGEPSAVRWVRDGLAQLLTRGHLGLLPLQVRVLAAQLAATVEIHADQGTQVAITLRRAPHASAGS